METNVKYTLNVIIFFCSGVVSELMTDPVQMVLEKH